MRKDSAPPTPLFSSLLILFISARKYQPGDLQSLTNLDSYERLRGKLDNDLHDGLLGEFKINVANPQPAENRVHAFPDSLSVFAR